MTTPVQTLFNPSVGIQSLLPMADAEPLPDAREVGASAVGRSTLESLYGPVHASNIALRPISETAHQ